MWKEMGWGGQWEGCTDICLLPEKVTGHKFFDVPPSLSLHFLGVGVTPALPCICENGDACE
jgi:hypothetical protein